jgi:hypothetical protein
VTNPLEDDVQVRIAHIYAAVGCFVVWFSQKRRTGQTPGIPDLYVIHPTKGAWWHEVKRAKGSRVRPAQAEFRKCCLAANVPHVIGDAEAAWAQLEAVGLVQATA